jgi:hypothetical protein
MNKFAYLLSVLLVTGLTSVANAQTNPKSQAPKTPAQVLRDSQTDYYMMKDGHMMMRMKDGHNMPMTENMTMSNGNMVMPDGTCTMKDGTKTTMKNGQCMMMDGKMTMHPGSTKRPMMKGGEKMGDMKM